jgi:DNA-binding NtrC family response regulator
VDVRLVAATNRDLKKMEEGKFREDLFYRLYVVNLALPPLRERDGDIVLLAQHYLKTLAAEHGKKVRASRPRRWTPCAAYAWPGNVRELRNVIERMVVLGTGES